MDTDSARPESIEDPDAWREMVTEHKLSHPDPELDTLIKPTWNALRHKKLLD